MMNMKRKYSKSWSGHVEDGHRGCVVLLNASILIKVWRRAVSVITAEVSYSLCFLFFVWISGQVLMNNSTLYSANIQKDQRNGKPVLEILR